MSVFGTNFYFLNQPGGEIEHLPEMKAVGKISGVFCNIGDYTPESWATIRNQASQQGMFCGVWLRTQVADNGPFSESKLAYLIQVADEWQQPLIVNSERELDGTGNSCTKLIAQYVGNRDGAVSMEAWLYNAVDWSPLANLPMLLQISPGYSAPSQKPYDCKAHAHLHGIKAVYFTFGTFGGQEPKDYDLKEPYSLYHANASAPNWSAWQPTSSGFDPYDGKVTPVPSPLPKLTDKQFPYTGPYYGPNHANGPSKGPTAEALKRAMSRLGYFAWSDFDQHYNQKLMSSMADWQMHKGITPPTGDFGKMTWDAMRSQTVVIGGIRQYALDAYALKLVQDEAKITSTSDKEALVQKYITEFWTISIAHAGLWHYNDNFRPVNVNANPATGGTSDCSGMVIQSHAYAKRKTGLNVPDPAKQHWSGYGNTDLYEDDWPKIGAPYRVGDLAHFHSSRHVIECIKPGDVNTAQWGSNGREAAPELIHSLASYSRFPSEFMFVVRPTLVII